MTDYHESYGDFCTKIANIQSQTIKDQVAHYTIITDLLGFTYWLQKETATIHNQHADYGMKHIHEICIDVAFSHNFLSLYMAFLAIERNLLHQARAEMRTVFESIPKIFYLSLHPNELDCMLIRDEINGIRDEAAKRKKIEDFKSGVGIPAFKSMDTDGILRRCKGKYNFDWILKNVYDERTTKIAKGFYSSLSDSVHARFTKSMPSYNKEAIHKTLRDVEFLLFYNIVAEIEGHGDMIGSGLFPFDESRAFVDKTLAVLKTDEGFPSLFPDHQSIATRVRVHPDCPPWK